MIQTVGLNKLYRTDEIETTALSNITLKINEKEFVAIMGPSGCGKTTLLNVLGMLDDPSSGAFYFLGEEVSRYSERERTELRKRHIGFIFQNFNLIDELTVFENIELPLVYLGESRADRKSRVAQVMEQMQLAARGKHFPQQLSGGQQQRVAVARALVPKPKLILADEPTGNLDSANGEEVMRMLSALNQGGTAVVMVTHAPAYARRANRVIQLLDGKVINEDATGRQQCLEATAG